MSKRPPRKTRREKLGHKNVTGNFKRTLRALAMANPIAMALRFPDGQPFQIKSAPEVDINAPVRPHGLKSEVVGGNP